jgi:putative IMPACT (imprinted ancient) family translation regulator
MNEGLKLVKQYQGNLLAQTFQDNTCEISINFRLSVIAQVKTKIKGLQVLGINISIV